VTPSAVLEAPTVSASPTTPCAPGASTPGYRLRAIMRQGTASSVADTWVRFASLDAACRASKAMYHVKRWNGRSEKYGPSNPSSLLTADTHLRLAGIDFDVRITELFEHVFEGSGVEL
jgi:hypothetical protein